MKKTAILLTTIILVILAATTAAALSFTENPAINNNEKPYLTTQNLECSWNAEGETSHSIKWYKADSGTDLAHEEEFDDDTVISSSSTSRGNRWICEVSIHNATDTLTMNSSIAHIAPWLAFENDTIVPEYHNLTEDITSTFYITSANPGDTGTTFNVEGGDDLCQIVSPSTGEITCTPRHRHVAGTEEPAPEEITNISVLIRESVGEDSFGATIHFTLIPVNDQAEFVSIPGDQTINANEQWWAVIEGVDEELDYPLSFAVESDLPLIITPINDTTANLSFDLPGSAPTNEHAGTHNITLNVTDSYGFNETRPATQETFELEILLVNNPPEFITNFTDIENMNWVQGDPFTPGVTIEAIDQDENDTLEFHVSNPVNQHECPYSKLELGEFPWEMITLDDTAENGTAILQPKNNSNITNDHVACRWVNITVTDRDDGEEKDTISQLVMLNITNVNDPPVIHEISEHGNISDQSAALHLDFNYQVNATDPDQLTYDAENTGVLSYYTNNTLFPINETTGLISFNPDNSSYVGNWSVLVTVIDNGSPPLNDTRIMNIKIQENTAPELTIYENNLEFWQNDNITMNFSGLELDNQSINITIQSLTNFSDSLYEAQTLLNNYSGGVNYELFNINLTQEDPRLANDQVGHHSIRIILEDEAGTSIEGFSTGILNFTVWNENDLPFFDMTRNNESDNVSLGPAVVGVEYEKTIYATDYDLLLPLEFANESLTFSYSNASNDLTNINFNKVSENSAVLRFTPTGNGEQNITLRVEDMDGAYDEQNISFMVYNASVPPVIEEVMPYYNTTTGEVIQSFANASEYPDNNIFLEFDVNTTLVFDALAQVDTASELGVDNNLTYTWFVDGEEELTVENANPGSDSEFEREFDLFSVGNKSVFLEITDSLGSSSNWTWNLSIQRIPLPPVYHNGTLEGHSINRTRAISNYFSYRNGYQRFYYVYDDTNQNYLPGGSTDLAGNPRRWLDDEPPTPTSLTYTAIPIDFPPCPAEFSVEGDDLLITPTGIGQCRVRFNATTPDGLSVQSELVTFNITGFDDPEPSPAPSPGGGATTRTDVVVVPFEQEVDVPAPIKIVIPSSAVMYANRTISVPVLLTNTWDEDIRGISLNASMSDDDNATFRFDRDFFEVMQPGQNITAMLTVSDYRSPGPHELNVHAFVSDPAFNDTASVLISGLEQAGIGGEDDVRVLVTYARDLLSDNVQCAELNALLDQADREFEGQNFEEARRILQSVINGCRYMVEEDEALRFERPGVLRSTISFADENAFGLLVSAAVLTAITIFFYLVAGIRNKMSRE